MTSTISSPYGSPGTPYGAGTDTGGSSSLVPDVFDVALGDIPFLIDTSQGGVQWRSSPLQRTAVEQSAVAGESTIDPAGFWRRSWSSWHLGGGQADADRAESTLERFRASKGVDCWTRWRLSLLNDTRRIRTSTQTNLAAVVAGTRLYVTDGGTVVYTTDPYAGTVTWTTVTGSPGPAATGIATDGTHVFVAFGSSGLYITDTSSGSLTQWKSGTVDGVGYALSRVMVWSGAALYNVTDSYGAASSPLSSPLMTHANSSWRWVGVAEGTGFIYAAGYAGDKSSIYRISIAADASSLAAPIVAGTLPDGEIVSSIAGYVGVVLIGTTRGVRIATPNANGDLVIGPLIETGSTVRGFEGQGRFVWFTWESFDAADGGLGRLDLSEFTGVSTPGYASDLMAAGVTEPITSPVTFGSKRVFCAPGDGVWAEDDTTLVSEGWVTLGDTRFGIPEAKTVRSVTATTEVASGSSVEIWLSTEGGTSSPLATFTASGQNSVGSLTETGAWHEAKVVLNRSTTDPTTGGVLTGLTLLAYPRAAAALTIEAALVVGSTVRPPGGGEWSFDTAAIVDDIRQWWADRSPVSWQELGRSETVVIEDMVFATTHPSPGRQSWEGTLILRMKVI
ncbi:MAG: hypothetical protein D6683_17895 [Actinomyces sp.]|nr:MAG: hypothetical protein D6683_17895 [Actinomyces sp.]